MDRIISLIQPQNPANPSSEIHLNDEMHRNSIKNVRKQSRSISETILGICIFEESERNLVHGPSETGNIHFDIDGASSKLFMIGRLTCHGLGIDERPIHNDFIFTRSKFHLRPKMHQNWFRGQQLELCLLENEDLSK